MERCEPPMDEYGILNKGLGGPLFGPLTLSGAMVVLALMLAFVCGFALGRLS